MHTKLLWVSKLSHQRKWVMAFVHWVRWSGLIWVSLSNTENWSSAEWQAHHRVQVLKYVKARNGGEGDWRHRGSLGVYSESWWATLRLDSWVDFLSHSGCQDFQALYMKGSLCTQFRLYRYNCTEAWCLCTQAGLQVTCWFALASGLVNKSAQCLANPHSDVQL